MKMKMKKKVKVMLGATVLVAALAPLSAYANTGSFPLTLGPATKTEATAKLKPGTVVADNSKMTDSVVAKPAGKEQGKNDSAEKKETSGSAALKPGTVADNTIGFGGSLPSSEVLTQIIEQNKKDAEKTGNYTAVVINLEAPGQEGKLTISLKDSTKDIVAQIQEKFNDTKPVSASATVAK